MNKNANISTAQPEEFDHPTGKPGTDDKNHFEDPQNLASDASGDKRESFDPFDPERLKLSQDFGAMVGVKKALLTVPVRKPAKDWWVRTHPEESYQIETAVIELKEDQETYLGDPKLWPQLATESTLIPVLLTTTINRQGVLFLWFIRLPGPDGRLNSWSRSALEAASLATVRWVRLQANMSLGGYEVFKTQAELPEPEWPEQSFRELLRIAFKDRLIENWDHPVLQRLRGEK